MRIYGEALSAPAMLNGEDIVIDEKKGFGGYWRLAHGGENPKHGIQFASSSGWLYVAQGGPATNFNASARESELRRRCARYHPAGSSKCS